MRVKKVRPPCTLQGCENLSKTLAGGLCHKHELRMKRNGTTNLLTVRKRFPSGLNRFIKGKYENSPSALCQRREQLEAIEALGLQFGGMSEWSVMNGNRI